MSEPWWHRAECIGTDPARWYPPSETPHAEVAETLQICQRCEVRASCLADAIEHEAIVYGLAYGIAGGTRPRHRQALVKARRTQLLAESRALRAAAV